MKSETAENDRNKVEGRQSIHRRKMSKNPSIVNGADESLSSYAAEDESMVRQINLAAAFHDHISCTKSAELCKIDGSRDTRTSLPCETDHIYANCSETRNNKSSPVVNNNSSTTPVLSTSTAKLKAENKRMKNLLVIQSELIKHLEHELIQKNNQTHDKKRNREPELLKSHQDRKDRVSALRNHHKSEEESMDSNISQVKSEINNIFTSSVTSTTSENSVFAVPAAASVANEHSSTIPPIHLVTRYFGRKSKTVPTRTLKRRYLGPPKSIPLITPPPVSLSSATSISSESEAHEDEMLPKAEVPKESKSTNVKPSLIDIKKISKKRGRKPKAMPRKTDYLTTDKAYFLPNNFTSESSLDYSDIDVPSCELRPVSSFYQMEGTENINDPVFHRRHLKYEQDERRRKRWDIQRLREATKKLKLKYIKNKGKKYENSLHQKSQSFYSNTHHLQYIRFTRQLPVMAFGHPIPLFQPSEFSISWKCGQSLKMEQTAPPPNKISRRGRLSSTTGPKVT